MGLDQHPVLGLGNRLVGGADDHAGLPEQGSPPGRIGGVLHDAGEGVDPKDPGPALRISPVTAMKLAERAGSDWLRYAALRASGPR